MDQLEKLHSLNLSDNFISKIENLSSNKQLETLQIKRNRVGINGVDDVIHLKELDALSSLDIQSNQIDLENPDDFIEILKQMKSLSVLYMQNNPICKKISHYRKKLIYSLPNLKYLDDRPIFEDERRYAMAFQRGGIEEERLERDKFREE